MHTNILQEVFSFDDNGTGNMIKSSHCFCLATHVQAWTVPIGYRRPHRLRNEFAIITGTLWHYGLSPTTQYTINREQAEENAQRGRGEGGGVRDIQRERSVSCDSD